jgi:hypothetical protein
MILNVDWIRLRPEYENLWHVRRAVYAYTTKDFSEFLYIGKATSTTVAQRWAAPDKQKLWRDLEQQRNIFGHQLLIGHMPVEPGLRLSMELLADIESLLIYRLQPWGNIQSQNSRISRPGMTIRCRGDWPHHQKVFRDC